MQKRSRCVYRTRPPVVITSLERRVLLSGTADQSAEPTLTLLNPSVMQVGTTDTPIGIVGTNFTSASVIELDGVALPTTYADSTVLTTSIPAADVATVGTSSITVVTPGDADTLPQTLTVTTKPTIAAMTPASVVVGSQDTTVTLTGTSFMPESIVYLHAPASASSAVLSATPLASQYVNGTTLTAVIPAANLAAVQTLEISVADPSIVDTFFGQREVTTFNSDPLPFAVATSTALTAVSPNSAVLGSPATTVTLVGTNFQPTSVAYITVPDPSDTGLTITGISTYDGNSSPTPSDGGSGTLTTTFVSPTELTATIPAADMVRGATLLIQVQSGTLGNTAELPFTVTVPPPLLIGISPASATVGSPDLTVTLIGAYFRTRSVVEYNGTPLATTALYENKLIALLPAAELTTAGAQAFTVVTPDQSTGGDVTTTAQPFTVDPPPPGMWSTVSAGTLPTKVATNAHMRSTVRVTLTDTATMAERGTTLIQLYAVPVDASAGSATSLLATVKRRTNLARNASQSLNVPVTLLPTTTGDYRLLTTTTDPAGRVATAVAGPIVTVGPPLASLSVAVSPATLVAGRPTTITVTVTNTGNIDFAGLLMMNITLTANPGTTGPGPLFSTHRTWRVLPSKPLIFKFKGGPKLTALSAGSYFWQMDVDQGSGNHETTSPVSLTTS